MNNTKNPVLHKIIPISIFEICLASGWTKVQIKTAYPSRSGGAYYMDKFVNHLKNDCNLTLKEYVKDFLKEEWPVCPINGEEVGYKLNGKGVEFSRFVGAVTKEHSPTFKSFCERISEERKGSGNPMFGKPSWVKGLSKDHPYIIGLSKRMTGHIKSPETIEKLKLAAKNRTKEPHLGHKHSKETKELFRERTAKFWAEGIFNKKTSIEVKVEDFLNELKGRLNHEFVFQYLAKYYTLDFAFPDVKVGIECQGTFFHIDPRVYPDGPICAIQRRNAGRDKSKRKYLTERGWTIIELWEIEINDGRFKEQLICELQKLNLIAELANQNV